MVRFALWPVVSKIQGRQKSEMHWMTPNWTWTLNSQKYPVYIKYLPQRPKFWSVSLYDQRFLRHRTFYNSPLTPMLNAQKGKQQQNNCQKIQNFTIPCTTLVENLLMSMTEFGEQIYLFCTCRQDCVWSFFSNMVPCHRDKLAKIQNFKFRLSLYNFGREPA